MIEIDNVTKRYGTTVAVDRLSFEVREGEVTGFLGPNGAGKSTPMATMMRLDLTASGQVKNNDNQPLEPRAVSTCQHD